jgi:hypothetical protein
MEGRPSIDGQIETRASSRAHADSEQLALRVVGC